MAPLSNVLGALLLTTSATALFNPFKRQTATPTTTADNSQTSCRGLVTNYLGASFCCPGTFENTSDASPFGSAYCCVGNVFSLPISAFSDRFGSATLGLPTSATAPLTRRQDASATTTATTSSVPACRSTIFLTDTQYSSKVNANGASATFSMGFTGPVSSEMTAMTTTATSTNGEGTTVLSGTKTTSTGPAVTVAPGSGGAVVSSISSPVSSVTSTSSTAAAARATHGLGYEAIALAVGGLIVAKL